jgi:hypothetical protein
MNREAEMETLKKLGVEVGVFGEHGNVDRVKLLLRSLSAEQVKAVFAPGPEPPTYVVNKGKLVVSRPTTFTKKMLENILRMMRD